MDTPVVPTLNPPLEGAIAALREREISLLTDVATTLGAMGDAPAADRRRLLDVAQDLRDAFFLVVIIGEFNAGKSSFINAMLGDELLAMGVTPTTEVIELIRYSEQVTRNPVVREDGIREWTHPNTGAAGVALVDTPGTGSVFQRHEKTAKAFLHRADLVIFVLSAKRAFGETERMYLELAKDYGKKVILVVNQVDLLGASEQQEVRRFVERQVEEFLDLRPLIFMVSAREALNARKAGQPEAGGVDAVRAHLRGLFDQAPPARSKLLAQLDMAQHIVTRYLDDVRSNAANVSADTGKVRDVQNELERQATGLDAQLRGARAEIDNVFGGLRQRGHAFIDAHLNIRRIGRPINREALQTEFQDVVIGRALRDVNEATGDYINALVDHSRLYWRGVIDRLNQLRDLLEQELSGLDAGVYAEQRESLEDAIRLAERELRTYSGGEVISELQTTFETNMSGFLFSTLAAVGGIAVAAAAVAAAGPLAGVTAFAFAAALPFAIGGSYLAYRYYRRVGDESRRELNERVDALQQAYHDALDQLTQKERSRLTGYGKQVLTPIFSRLDVLSTRYNEQQGALRGYLDAITALRRDLDGTT